MSCYKPLKCWRILDTASGKYSISFKDPQASESKTRQGIQIACGQCIGCREDRSKAWAIRAYHELKYHPQSCFITLTFDPEHLDPTGSLQKRDFQLFMKRLRKHFNGLQIRYFHVGEYGAKYGRPHHHAILFGVDFVDKVLFSTDKGLPVYTSLTLEKLWTFGFSTVGAADFDSAAYIARYCTKKLSGKAAEAYEGKLPEYNSMSRMPVAEGEGGGIGWRWYNEFGEKECFDQDFIVLRGGSKMKPPKYYDRQYEIDNPVKFDKIRAVRLQRAKENPDNSPERLKARHEVALARHRQRKRSFENG